MLPSEPSAIPPEPPGPIRSFAPVTPAASRPGDVAEAGAADVARDIVSLSVAGAGVGVTARRRGCAELPLTVQVHRRAVVPQAAAAVVVVNCRRPSAELPLTVQPVRRGLSRFSRPPPYFAAELPLTVQPGQRDRAVVVEAAAARRPVLPLTVQSVRVAVP